MQLYSPILAIGQHYFFKQPFSRKANEDDIILSDDDNASLFTMGQRPLSTRLGFGFADTNRPGANLRNGVGVGPRLGNDLVDRITNSGLWDSFKRK